MNLRFTLKAIIGILVIIPTYPQANVGLNSDNESSSMAGESLISGGLLPDTIFTDMNLTVEESPYTAEGDVIVISTATLSIQSGVVIQMRDSASIYIEGTLNALGQESAPVKFTVDPSGERWGAINFRNASPSILSHVIIENGSHGGDESSQPATINAFDTDLTIENAIFRNNINCIFGDFGKITIRDSKFMPDNLLETINLRFGIFEVDNNEFYNLGFDSDAIDFDGVVRGIVSNNYIYEGQDDGIDIGDLSRNVTIFGNFISGMTDKGISIGEDSEATVSHNTIVDCDMGIAVKDKSIATVSNSTLHNNRISLLLYDKDNNFPGTPTVIAINNIFSSSVDSDLDVEQNSILTLSYSLSDNEALAGVGNILGEPRFTDTLNSDFSLLPRSDAIDKGDPESLLDPDFTRADIGAHFYDFGANGLIIITEINYESDVMFDAGDWIEISNAGEFEVDLTNWVFRDSENNNMFEFPTGKILLPDEYLVLTHDSTSFLNLFPDVENVLGQFDFELSDSGELVRIFDQFNILVDSVRYSISSPWPVEQAGSGRTLELESIDLDNSRPISWRASISPYGSPGNFNVLDLEW